MDSASFRYLLPAALCGLGLAAWLPAASGDNCTFRADPDAYLERSVRILRETHARAAKWNRASSPAARFSVPASEIPVRNFIDEEIFGELRRRNVPSAPLSTDEEFVRRIHLDLTGRVPSPHQVREFLADSNPAKRRDLIDRLLYSPAFNERWTLWLGDLLENNITASNFSQQVNGRNAFWQWIRLSLAAEKSWRDMAWELVTGKGNNYDKGEVNWAAKSNAPGGPVQDRYDLMMVRTVTTFLGLGHYDCLACHDGRGHLEQLSLWGRRVPRVEAYRMAAFFSRLNVVGRTNNPNQPGFDAFYVNSVDITDRPTGDYPLGTTFGNRPARSFIGSMRSVAPEYRFGQTPSHGDWRAAFADFMTQDPMFAINMVNRLWKQMFNLGLVEPVDALDPARLDASRAPAAGWSHQATHPRLLERLAAEFVAGNYNLREFLRRICESSAYQLSSRYDAPFSFEHTTLFPRHYPRRLEGEEVHDALAAASGVFVTMTVQNLEEQFRWGVQMPDSTEPRGNPGNTAAFMNLFGRGNRDTQKRSQAGSVLMQLGLMNMPFVLDRIRVANSPTLRDLSRLTDNRQLVEEMWLLFLTRNPGESERALAEAYLARAGAGNARNAAIEDLAWALVNKLEFLFSY